LNRYYYYLILNNMLINVFMFVPSILIRERFNGTVLAIPIGALIGTACLLIFSYSINQFPTLGLPEIFERTPKWFRFGFLSFFSFMWFSAGTIFLLAFNNVIIRMVNPDIQGIHMIFVFVLWLLLVLNFVKTERILFALEIIIILNIPFIALFVYESYTNEYLTLSSIFEVGTYVYETPSINTIAAASFVFSGYANLVIFNRVFREKIKIKRLWLIPFLGIFNIITSVFIPIGIWGADGIGDLTFPWVSTADTLRIEYGPIERLITLFILLYVGISLISVTIHWHVALEILKSLRITNSSNRKRKSIFNLIILGFFGLTVIVLEQFLKEGDIFILGEIWLNIRLPSEIFLVGIMFFLARRHKKT
jgi:hypothetical protein